MEGGGAFEKQMHKSVDEADLQGVNYHNELHVDDDFLMIFWTFPKIKIFS